ncbi:MAG: hypothetical protein KDD51_08720 [Bdellovibrionales bacterium]|nr:hypothetical protein [Bdellovibrionales bacterium]
MSRISRLMVALFLCTFMVSCRGTKLAFLGGGPVSLGNQTGLSESSTQACTTGLQADLKKLFPATDTVAPGTTVVLEVSASGCTQSYRVQNQRFSQAQPLVLSYVVPNGSIDSIQLEVESLDASGQVVRTAMTNLLVLTVSASAPPSSAPQVPTLAQLPFAAPSGPTECQMIQLTPGGPDQEVFYIMLISSASAGVLARFNGEVVAFGGIAGQRFVVGKVLPNDDDVYVAAGEVIDASNAVVSVCGHVQRLPGCEIQLSQSTLDGVIGEIENIGVKSIQPTKLNGAVESFPVLLPGEVEAFEFVPGQIGAGTVTMEIRDSVGNRNVCSAGYNVSADNVSVSATSKHVYYYTSAGVDLFALDGGAAVATGYGTRAWGEWAIVGGVSDRVVTEGASYQIRRQCATNEVATGAVSYGQLRCTPLASEYELFKRSTHTGGWGYNMDVRCPANKVMVEWQYPLANYTLTYSCAEIRRVH